MPVPACVRLPLPLMAPPKVGSSERLKTSAAVVGHRTRAQGAAGSAVADLQRAGGDRRAARVGVAARQGQDARAGLRQAAAAADDAAEGQVVGVVENQRVLLSRHAGPVPRSSPLPPLPTCSVPAEIVVPPV